MASRALQALRPYNLSELIEKRRTNRTAFERSARRNMGEELKKSRSRLSGSLAQLQEACAHAPLTPALLRNAPALRGALAAELRAMSAEDVVRWLQADGAAATGFAHTELDYATVGRAGALSAAEIANHGSNADAHFHRGGGQKYASQLPPVERWRLHNGLKLVSLQTATRELEAAISHYRRLVAALGELDDAESLEQLTGAAVVGLTTTGAAKYQTLVRLLGCRVLVMEEAAEVR